MRTSIKVSTLLQYMLIYLMLVFNGANLYQQISINRLELLLFMQIFITGVFFLCCIKYKFKKSTLYPTKIILCIVFFAILVRLNVGGVGLQALLEYSAHVFLVFLAIIMDKEKFLDRLIKTIYFFALISIVCYIIQIVSPTLLQKVLKSYSSIFNTNKWEGGMISLVNMRVWGVVFFSMREGEMKRNLGIFTEPANYQIVLNSAIFIILFLRDYLNCTDKQMKRFFLILSIALITCRSTSGYIVFLVLIIVYIFLHNEKDSHGRLKTNIICIVLIGIVFLVVDYLTRREHSVLYLVAFRKLFDMSGNMDLSVGTGYYRVVTIESSISSMIKHPLGVGFDWVYEKIKNTDSGAAGGALFLFGAALGVLPFLSVILWTLMPVAKSRILRGATKLAYIFMFIEISMAQSKVFYPLLISIPLYLYIVEENKRNI